MTRPWHHRGRKGVQGPRRWCVLAVPAIVATIAGHAAATGLPGGSSALRETYDRWEVACVAQETSPRCFMMQTLLDGESRQRLLTVEVLPAPGGTATATLIMPFGLDLAKGVTLSYGDDAKGPSRPITTCLPIGCIVPLAFDAATIAGLKKAATLTVGAVTMDGGKAVRIPVPLKGFPAAFARISAMSN
ncbi:invasion protein (plasmid) [Azospirillum humicireducens]|uniref:Invasion protein n=1 Tax=Azospirillum humicireducens TaxID=1226968 RepID=A0A2R4VTP1_9PROT|nr:invasion associated locus B family protein [Azospirillum humicireducens]AWB07809.1 invasion protein [Azospirillum humicireducens]